MVTRTCNDQTNVYVNNVSLSDLFNFDIPLIMMWIFCDREIPPSVTNSPAGMARRACAGEFLWTAVWLHAEVTWLVSNWVLTSCLSVSVTEPLQDNTHTHSKLERSQTVFRPGSERNWNNRPGSERNWNNRPGSERNNRPGSERNWNNRPGSERNWNNRPEGYIISAAHTWNSLPFTVSHGPSLLAFKISLKTYLLKEYLSS